MSLVECTYMTDGAVMPFCKGCGHTHILNKLDEALHKLGQNPKDVCLVTDIGCIGLADALFDKVHTVHTTHGRSTAFATGIAVADKVLAGKNLKTIVLIGDGGSMIGLLHIVNAALMNVDVTVIVANNFLFGMTGGQQSSLTPEHFITQTTPFGSMNPALDICAIARASKAGFIARKTSTDKDLADILAGAIEHNGLSFVEILELCTEHAVKRNELKGNKLAQLAEAEGHDLGLLKNDDSRPEFSIKYDSDVKSFVEEIKPPKFIEAKAQHNLKNPLRIIISGSAGEKVQSSAAVLCEASVSSGLQATQKNDNPITQGSGFSLSEVILSPDEINYTGVDLADFVIIASEAGLRELESQNIYNRSDKNTVYIIDESIKLKHNDSKVIQIPLRKLCGAEKAALGGIDYLVRHYSPFPHEVILPIIQRRIGEHNKIFKKEYYDL